MRGRAVLLLAALLLVGPAGAWGWTRQNTTVSQGVAAGTSIAPALGRSPLTGELLVALVSWDSSGYSAGTVSVTDNGTGTANTWVKAWETLATSDFQYSALFWTVNARTSSTVSIVTAQFGASVTFRSVVVRTYSGNAAQASQPSGTAQSVSGSHTTGTDSITAGSTTTPNQASAMVVAGGYCGGSATLTAGTGFGNASSAGASSCVALEDQEQTTATATAGPATSSASGNHSWGVIAFNSISDTEAPTDPTSLTATAAGSSQISLTWTASTDNIAVTAYLVERCQGAACVNFAQVTSVATNAYDDQGLSSSTLYRYRVRAQDSAVNLSGYSNTAQDTTAVGGDTQAPTAPSALAAFAGGTTGIDLGWALSTDNVAVTAYRIERCAGSGCVNFAEIAQTTAALTYADRGLTPDVLYRYRLRSQDAIPNFSTYTSVVEARTRTQSPTLSWTDNSSDETGFIIARREACGVGSFTDVVTVDAGITQWSDTTAQATEMEYRVRATNTGGDSANTSSICWTKERQVHTPFSGRTRTVPPVGVRQR